MHFIIPEDRDQFTLYGKLDDLVPSDHPIRLLDLLVDKIVNNNLKIFTQKGQQEVGRRAFHPGVLAKLYLYGYCNRIASSRRLEAESYRNIELIWLLGGLKPDHKTIADYRKDHSDAIRFLTLEFRLFLKQNGYIKGETISLDGTKIKANANKELLSIEKIEKMLKDAEGKLEDYLEKLNLNDLKDDLLDEIEEYPEDQSKEILINKIAELQEKIEKLTSCKEILIDQKINTIAPTDNDARLMRSRDGKIPAYNTQVAVDAENKMIVYAEPTNDPTDVDQLEPAKVQIKEQLDIDPERMIADKGYYNVPQIQSIESSGETECYIPWAENKSKTSDRENGIFFKYNEEKDEYVCSEGQRLPLKAKNKKKHKRVADLYVGINCFACPKRNCCTKSKKGRNLYRYTDEEWVNSFKDRMLKQEAKRMSKLRKELSEHVFGTIKILMGKIPLLMREKQGVRTEIDLYSTVFNFKRLIKINFVENLINEMELHPWKVI